MWSPTDENLSGLGATLLILQKTQHQPHIFHKDINLGPVSLSTIKPFHAFYYNYIDLHVVITPWLTATSYFYQNIFIRTKTLILLKHLRTS